MLVLLGLFWLVGLLGIVGFVIIENVNGLLGVKTFSGWISSFGSTWIPISALYLTGACSGGYPGIGWSIWMTGGR